MINRKWRRIVSLLMAAMLVAVIPAVSLAADPSVTFQNNNVVVFAPGSVYTNTDLFAGFKGIMPGDQLTEKITVQNNVAECDYIKVYMRAMPHVMNSNPPSTAVLDELNADTRRGITSELAYMNDFLSQLSMRVYNGTDLIYQASPDQTDGLANNVLLGQLLQGETLSIDVQLSIPVTLDNAYAGRVGEVDWVFIAEGFDNPVPNDKTLTVNKVWADYGVAHNERIVVNLLRDGVYVESVELGMDNQWTYTWVDLEERYTWSAVEATVVPGYVPYYSRVGDVITITNTNQIIPPYEPPMPPVELTVVKAWNDNGRNRPNFANITLYNGETPIETVRVGDWNNWSYQWRNLDGNTTWRVVEANIPNGYVPSYYARNGTVTIMNTSTLLKTGQLNWPIPVLGGLGILLLGLGTALVIRKRKKKNV